MLCAPDDAPPLARFEQQHSHLTQVEVDEVLGLMSDVAAEVPAHNAMPCGVVLPVEFFLDESSDVFLHVELLHGLGGAFDGILLHIFCHVGILNDGFALRHDDTACGVFSSLK